MVWREETHTSPTWTGASRGVTFHPGCRPAAWTGQRLHLCDNKGVFGAEVYAICQALSNFGAQNDTDARYTVLGFEGTINQPRRTSLCEDHHRNGRETSEVRMNPLSRASGFLFVRTLCKRRCVCVCLVFSISLHAARRAMAAAFSTPPLRDRFLSPTTLGYTGATPSPPSHTA